jgi:hypothetical protein
MGSSLTRTLKTKDRLCYEAIKGGDVEILKKKKKPRAGTTRWMGYLALAVEVVDEAQQGIQGTQPQNMHPDWYRSRTLLIGRYLLQRELLCLGE